MSTEMKTGLVLSGGGAVGAYQAGVVKALAECGTQISMVSGASIGAFNGAIIAASPDLSEAAVRLEALWDHLGNNQVLSVNRLVYFSLLKKLFQAMNLCQIPGRAGALLTTLLRHISTINGFDNLMAQPLLSDEPLTALMDHYLDTDALADGLPLYVSLYPTEGGMQDIIDCIRAELGVGTTKNAVFQHIQSLPRGQQKEALLASAALPLLFRPREVQGTMFGDGGMGGWRNMQGNTPVTPLVDAGCNMVIVTHLSDGSLWDRQAFPDTTILEIRPRKRLKYAGDGIWNLYTLNNGGAFMAPEPDDDDDETWVLFNAMNGNRAEMSPEAAGIAACLMTYSHHACRTENYAMTVHYYRLRDYALQHPECSAIMRIID
ncbi:patatin-like phospholipase family protein [Escherichia coli]|nr:patatin-like phospholipase family protein [Escherichia coli]HAO2784741.1 patatin-like phospholipase family protein [Escherichia coli]